MTNQIETVGETTQENDIKDFGKFLIELAIQEGRKFEQENGRKPTEAEAGRIADMIQRQLRTALIMSK